MKKVNYTIMPQAIEPVGNGSYLYRWAIEEITIEAVDDREAQTLWECYEVTIWGTPTENLITERVINSLWGGGVEQKLFNDYQASILGMLDEGCAEPYLDFLVERQARKVQIANDVAQWMNAI